MSGFESLFMSAISTSLDAAPGRLWIAWKVPFPLPLKTPAPLPFATTMSFLPSASMSPIATPDVPVPMA